MARVTREEDAGVEDDEGDADGVVEPDAAGDDAGLDEATDARLKRESTCGDGDDIPALPVAGGSVDNAELRKKGESIGGIGRALRNDVDDDDDAVEDEDDDARDGDGRCATARAASSSDAARVGCVPTIAVGGDDSDDGGAEADEVSATTLESEVDDRPGTASTLSSAVRFLDERTSAIAVEAGGERGSGAAPRRWRQAKREAVDAERRTERECRHEERARRAAR